MPGWAHIASLLKEERIQRRDEGCTVPARLSERLAAIAPDDDAERERCYDELMALTPDPALAAREPDGLEAIRALRPDGPRDLRWRPTDRELLDRLHGAWTGRCVGCALGKPVESRGLRRDADGRLSGRKSIKAYLTRRGEWPLSDYFSSRDIGDGDTIASESSVRERIAFMPADDDIHYSLAGLGLLEQHGADFTWQDVARYWLGHIPISAICTAEAQAILNVQNVSSRGRDIARGPEWTSTYRNPYREWIGAQIRSDGFAFCCAGMPERAAEFAWRDAHWTHRRNGIYGEMMFAAIQAAAFAESDPETLVRIGLSEIPRDCRLARWVNASLAWCREHADFESCMDRLESELADMHVVHTINNALICVLAMLYGRLDTTRSPTIAVMCGMDTDCNGATVGSIAGAVAGRKRFGGTLADRLNDTVKPEMLGFQEVRMRELAERCARVRASLTTLGLAGE